MLDEAQDANPAILDILSHQTVQKIYVGDQNQQIYGFRGTVNAMNSIVGDMYPLTQSFRFGDAIANEANKILLQLRSDNLLKGYPGIPSKIDSVDMTQPYTFIARTNAELINTIISKPLANKKIHFVGDIDRIISLFEGAYYLWKGETTKIIDYTIKRFTDWDTFTEEATLSKDHEYSIIIDFVYNHRDRIPKVLSNIRRVCAYTEDEADVIVTTAHRAKGRQWHQVYIHDDFLIDYTVEEKHIYYVALTRASHIMCNTMSI